jgi:hypothetical protein
VLEVCYHLLDKLPLLELEQLHALVADLVLPRISRWFGGAPFIII